MVRKKLQKLKKNKIVIIAVVICIVVCFLNILSVKAVDDDEASDYSFYNLSSNMSMALSTIAA